MNLTLSGEFAKHILNLTRKDEKLAEAFAQQLLGTVNPVVLANYLLTGETVESLLTNRIQKYPEATLNELNELLNAPAARTPQRRGRTAQPTSRRKTGQSKAKPGAHAAKAVRGRKRNRLAPGQVEKLKADVKAFLTKHSWATRKQITTAVHFPSLAAYNRIMGELREAKVITSQGQKAKTIYALKGTAAKGKGKPAASTATKNPPAKRKTPAKAKVVKKTVAKPAAPSVRKRSARPPLLCPFPGCTNKGAPVFGMMCKEHKDLPKEERDKLFANRRQSQPPPAETKPAVEVQV